MKHITVLYKIFSVLLLVFIAVATLQAQAPTELNISSGDINIPGAPNKTNYIITGTTTTNKITIEAGYEGSITLKNLKITRAGQASTTASCITVKGRYFTGTTMTEDTKNSNRNPLTKVNFILDGTNELLLAPNNVSSGSNNSSVYCALQVDRGAQIHISAIDPNDNGSGILIAKSTSKLPGDKVGYQYGNGGAGIGSRNYASSSTNSTQGKVQIYQVSGSTTSTHSQRYASGGNIIISSGTITAWGGHGAGIGGGWRTYYDGSIIIYGGKVESRTARHSAGMGSGCPDGGGVIQNRHADNSMIIVLPPADIEAYGADETFDVNPNLNPELAKLALSGAQVIAYMNDPNKSLITIHTQPLVNGSDLFYKEKNANIYLDLSETIVKTTTSPITTITLEDVFNTLGITYDLKKVRVGRTDAITGDYELNGQFDQETTFFTDASSSVQAYLGRPFMPVRKRVTTAETIVLPILDMEIAFTDYPSTPLHEGYTAQEARQNAHMIKMVYNDQYQMTNLTFRLQGGGADFESLIFLDSNQQPLSSAPTELNQWDTYYIVLPIIVGKPVGIYSDVLLIGGDWNGDPLPGYIRRIGEQRVVKDDTGENRHIKVTASPTYFLDDTYPATETVDLTLNIDHTGTDILYDERDVKAKYLITTEPEYDLAFAANPDINTWKSFNIPAANGQNRVTNVSFSDMPKGIHYIHWYVSSGVVYAHSEDISDPLKENGAFGPYIIAGPIVAGKLSGNPSVCSGGTPSEIKGELSTGGSGDLSYQWQISTDGINWVDVGGNTQNYTPAVLTVSPTYFRRLTTDNIYGGVKPSDNVFAIYIVSDGQTFYWKQNAANNNWNDPANWVDENGTALNMIPVSCSNVYIPGGAVNYPSLHPDKTPVDVCGEPMCTNITFAYGAELIYQHKLTYQKAYVQYNWGYYDGFSGVNHGDQPSGNSCSPASAKKRDKWYALAAPLKSMATGDFSLVGYPLTWQAGFAMSHPLTGLEGGEIEVGDFGRKFSTNDMPLSETNNAIAVKVASFQNSVGCDDHCNLDGLKGIIEIPYFENSAKSAFYPGHTYDRFTKESKFYYFNPQTLQLLHSPVGIMKRGNEAYRFIYEEGGIAPDINVAGTPSTVPGYKLKVKKQNSTSMKVMVGNPFMTSINAKQFFDANNDGNKLVESAGYQLFNSEDETWRHHEFAAAGNIPPLQAFIVTLKNDEVELLFPLEGTYALAGLAISGTPPGGGGLGRSLYLKSSSSNNLEGDYSVLVADAEESAVNVKKMIYSQGHTTPETFFIAPDNKDYNLIQAFEKGIREIGIGVKSSDTKNILSLTFENVDEFYIANNLRPVLIDKHLGTKQDLISNNTYSFNQRPISSENKYIDADRFVLRLSSSDDLLEDEKGISIVYKNKQVEIKADQNIQEIRIYDMLGRRVFSEDNVNTNSYTKLLTLGQGVYMVKVYTDKGKAKVEKIMIL